VGRDRARPPAFPGPPFGDQPGPDFSFHFSFSTDPFGLSGVGGSAGSLQGDTSGIDFAKILDRAASAASYIQSH